MSDPYLGEIRMFGGNFAPRNWALCIGTLLPIVNNSALYSLLGTAYGGDGRNDFALPDMRGRIPVHQGMGPGLTPRIMGQRFGEQSVVLTLNDIPNHSHSLQVNAQEASTPYPSGAVLASQIDGDMPYTGEPDDPTKKQTLNTDTIAYSGGSQTHYNLMPYQCVSFIICTLGTYPNRN
ncbi:phage tail protein [Teredinibacter sp. KSP-S5-2]|uniref:phage tail protein n=1 Tax=Teredinibacter sp. KSP-S5-2 TaxID=3034506 RepID=UPI0029350B22|nr:tail fiber protein [Teredinibacter sp. KSP-S5-2]WNO09090.1 tail fiber protein [Teredinibacter sp. KSP-S5-2]